MKFTTLIMTVATGAILSSGAMASKPGTNTVPMQTVKMVEEKVSTTSASVNHERRERVFRTVERVFRSERRERRERTERRGHERRERRHERRHERH
jgi:hypothetical protein